MSSRHATCQCSHTEPSPPPLPICAATRTWGRRTLLACPDKAAGSTSPGRPSPCQAFPSGETAARRGLSTPAAREARSASLGGVLRRLRWQVIVWCFVREEGGVLGSWWYGGVCGGEILMRGRGGSARFSFLVLCGGDDVVEDECCDRSHVWLVAVGGTYRPCWHSLHWEGQRGRCRPIGVTVTETSAGDPYCCAMPKMSTTRHS